MDTSNLAKLNDFSKMLDKLKDSKKNKISNDINENNATDDINENNTINDINKNNIINNIINDANDANDANDNPLLKHITSALNNFMSTLVNNQSNSGSRMFNLPINIGGPHASLISPAQIKEIKNSINKLIENNDINNTSLFKKSLLMAACEYKFEEEALKLIELGADLDYIDAKHDTALLWACFRNQPIIANKLLDMGAKINIHDQVNNTELHYIVKNNMYDTFCKILLRDNVDLNALDNIGATPLIVACIKNNTKMATELIIKGAKLDIAGKDDMTALDIAKKMDNKILINLLSTKIQCKKKEAIGDIFKETSINIDNIEIDTLTI